MNEISRPEQRLECTKKEQEKVKDHQKINPCLSIIYDELRQSLGLNLLIIQSNSKRISNVNDDLFLIISESENNEKLRRRRSIKYKIRVLQSPFNASLKFN